jgi:hypothetical protein
VDEVVATPQTTPSLDNQLAESTLVPTTISTPAIPSTWTPLPTLLSNDADTMFRNWLGATPTCRFPCWANIIPGKTSWAEAIHVLDPVLELYFAKGIADCRFGPCKYLAWQYQLEGNIYSGNLFSQEDNIYSIFLEGGSPLEYGMQKVFAEYGQPTQVFVYTNPYTYAGEPPQLDVVVLYAKDRFTIRYIWLAQLQDQNIVACDEPSAFMLGVVAIDESQWTDLEIAQNGRQLDNGSTGNGGLRPVENALDMSVDVFYQRVLEGEASFCIETPVKYWQ